MRLWLDRWDRTLPIDPGTMPIDNGFYDNLGDSWWDPAGPVSILHEMTPLRAVYFDRTFVEILGEEIRQSGEIIDVGCGGGLLTEALAKRGYPITGWDISDGALSAARRHAVLSESKVKYQKGSIYHLEIPSHTVDGVIAADIFEHLHDLPRAVSEISRILKPGGVLAFDTVNRTWLSLIGAIWVVQRWLRVMPVQIHNWRMFITPRELGAVLQDFGLEIRQIRGFSPAGHPVRWLFNLWLHRKFGPYRLTEDLRISYIGYAIKRD